MSVNWRAWAVVRIEFIVVVRVLLGAGKGVGTAEGVSGAVFEAVSGGDVNGSGDILELGRCVD